MSPQASLEQGLAPACPPPPLSPLPGWPSTSPADFAPFFRQLLLWSSLSLETLPDLHLAAASSPACSVRSSCDQPIKKIIPSHLSPLTPVSSSCHHIRSYLFRESHPAKGQANSSPWPEAGWARVHKALLEQSHPFVPQRSPWLAFAPSQQDWWL